MTRLYYVYESKALQWNMWTLLPYQEQHTNRKWHVTCSGANKAFVNESRECLYYMSSYPPRPLFYIKIISNTAKNAEMLQHPSSINPQILVTI